MGAQSSTVSDLFSTGPRRSPLASGGYLRQGFVPADDVEVFCVNPEDWLGRRREEESCFFFFAGFLAVFYVLFEGLFCFWFSILFYAFVHLLFFF